MLEVVNLRREFRVGRGWFAHQSLVAVNEVSFQVVQGTTVAIVGESGSGKSTIGRCLVRLLEPTAGQIRLDGIDLTQLSASAFRPYQRKLQMVFQDPGESLNPRLTIGETLSEPLRHWQQLRGQAVRHGVHELLAQVQLDSTRVHAYPHQLSGGQQQRIGIARALAAQPELIVLDEPTSALDVSVQAQILNLLVDLQQQTGVAYVLISHDLATVRYLAQEVIVLYLGQVMERGPVATIFTQPQHPYTRALLNTAPRLSAKIRDAKLMLKGETSNPLDVGDGCPLAPRCPLAQTDCFTRHQTLVEVAPGHAVACHVVTGP
ncbi:MAG: oligopeptide/dipeptide ABC transporter ATP-binding protein [Caldilineaceae bacterium]